MVFGVRQLQSKKGIKQSKKEWSTRARQFMKDCARGLDNSQ